MMIELIEGGKCLIACSKESKEEIGQARRVAFTTPRGTQKLWAVELEGKFEGLLKTWDDCAKFFRDQGAIVKIRDEGDGPKHEAEVRSRSKVAGAPATKREPMRSPRVTGKREPVDA